MLLNASGCLDALTAPETARSLDAFVTKTVTPEPREGNPPVRIAETDYGMLNAIGLANPGRARFLAETLPALRRLAVPLWVSVGGFSAEDYAETCAALDDDLGVRDEHRRLGVPLGAEAEHRRGRAEALREVGQRRDPDPAADEERPLDVQAKAVPERPEDVDRLSRLERRERPRPRPDRIDEEGELRGRGEAEAHRPRQQPAGRLEHEELTRDSGVERPALDLQQAVRADRLAATNR